MKKYKEIAEWGYRHKDTLIDNIHRIGNRFYSEAVLHNEMLNMNIKIEDKIRHGVSKTQQIRMAGFLKRVEKELIKLNNLNNEK